MTSEFIYIFLISALPCALAQISVSISAPSIVKPSENMRLTCHVSGALITQGDKIHAVNFVRQFSDGRLEFMAHLNHDNIAGNNPAFQSRLTLSRDTVKNEVYVDLSCLGTADSATYYCTATVSSIAGTAFDSWGPGTTVTVTSEVQVAPQVFPLIPFGQDMKSTVTAGCLALKYFPNPLSVAWSTTTGQNLSEDKHIQFPLSGNPLRYSLVSQITVSQSDWASKSYRCDVKHFSRSIQKTIPSGCIQLPTSPSVQILQKPCFSNIKDEVELSCQAYNLTIQNPEIEWFINEVKRPLPQELFYLEKVNTFYGIHSIVSIPQGEWSNGARIKCKVTDTKTKKSSEASARKCSENFNCLGIKVMMVPPTIEQLYVHKTAPIGCIAYDMKDTKVPSFHFSYPGAPSNPNVQIEDYQLNQNYTYSVTSFLIVEPETWLSYKEFTCIFEYPGLSEPIITTISKNPETKLLPPSIAVFPPPQEDLANGELCTLTCTAYRFNPEDIFMAWAEGDTEIFLDQQVNSGPKRNSGNQSFSATSLLSIPCSKWKDGTSYSCLVGHEAIATKISRKSIDKHSGNPAVVNVSVAMSDTTLSCH